MFSEEQFEEQKRILQYIMDEISKIPILQHYLNHIVVIDNFPHLGYIFGDFCMFVDRGNIIISVGGEVIETFPLADPNCFDKIIAYISRVETALQAL